MRLSLLSTLIVLGALVAGRAAAEDCSGTITTQEALDAESARYAAQMSNDFAAMGKCNDDAWLLDRGQLEFDPGADVIDRGSQPFVHCAPICGGIDAAG